MKKYLNFFIVLFTATTTYGSSDTVRVYNTNDTPVYYRKTTIAMQAARFDIQQEGKLTSMRIMLGGKSQQGSATVHVFGIEGGSPVPVLETDLIAPMSINKQKPGNQWVEISVPDGGIVLKGSQFFIAISGLSDSTKLLTDHTQKAPQCSSPTGGNFLPQAIKHSDGHWEQGSFSYFIEPYIEYSITEDKPVFTRDTAAIPNIDSTQIGNPYNGISAGDINRDGFIDLMSNGRLYKNDSSGRFTDISAASALPGRTRAQAFLDIDNDGDVDILCILPQATTNHLLLLNDGSGKFTPESITFPRDVQYGSGISVGDVNNDSYPDILIGQFLPLTDDSTHNIQTVLLLNSKTKGFIDHSDIFSLDGKSDQQSQSRTRGTSFIDINRDGLLDMYISNSFGVADEIFYNTGGAKFERIEGPAAGANIGLASGCQWVDVDNNGTPDLTSPQIIKAHMKRMKREAGTEVYKNSNQKGSQPFASSQPLQQILFEEYHSGCSWGDIDNSGTLDCILTTSCDCRYAGVYLQQKSGELEESTLQLGFNHMAANQDGMWVDTDNDGDLELVTWQDNHIVIYKNNNDKKGNFIAIDLAGVSGNAGSIGAIVTVYAGNNAYNRDVTYGRGLGIQDPLRLHIGIDQADKIDSVSVQWPGSQATEIFKNIPMNTITAIEEGKGTRSTTNEQMLQASITAYPNPFTDEVFFTIELKSQQSARLAIYSLTGELITVIHDAQLSQGNQRLQWNGHTSAGVKAPNGSYIYKFTVGDQELNGRIILAY
jgi:hypothetical protein